MQNSEIKYNRRLIIALILSRYIVLDASPYRNLPTSISTADDMKIAGQSLKGRKSTLKPVKKEMTERARSIAGTKARTIFDAVPS